MKNIQLILSSIQAALLVALVLLAIKISRQLPAHQGHAIPVAIASVPYGTLDVNVQNLPTAGSPLPVDVQNQSFDVDVQNTSLPVDVQNTSLDVDVQTISAADELDVNVKNWPDESSPLPVAIHRTQ
jgi:hypothetical protein